MITDDLHDESLKKWIAEQMPTRIQFTNSGQLIAECIVQGTREADRVSAAFFRTRYRNGKSLGGACIARADKTRYWNISVGSIIQ